MNLLVVAPHPDDEILGVGGTIMKKKHEGWEIAWLIVTGIDEALGWPEEKVASRKAEIATVSERLQFDRVFELGFPSARLDTVPRSELIGAMSKCFMDFQPNEVYLPHRGDIHSDHGVVAEAAIACTKWFRQSSVRRILSYETLSETDMAMEPAQGFHPNVLVDISPYLAHKCGLLNIYASEVGDFPFPRSEEAVTALAKYRGASAGFEAAEGFMLLKEREYLVDR